MIIQKLMVISFLIFSISIFLLAFALENQHRKAKIDSENAFKKAKGLTLFTLKYASNYWRGRIMLASFIGMIVSIIILTHLFK